MTDQAIDHNELDAALRRCGSSWHAGQVHGLLCSRLAVGGAAGAKRWFEQVLEETNNPTIRNAAHFMLGDALKETGRMDEAVVVLERALKENLRHAK